MNRDGATILSVVFALLVAFPSAVGVASGLFAGQPLRELILPLSVAIGFSIAAISAVLAQRLHWVSSGNRSQTHRRTLLAYLFPGIGVAIVHIAVDPSNWIFWLVFGGVVCIFLTVLIWDVVEK
ncbi:hypothetical protein [Halococcoides cellulosivorans]|uniref:Uncharacterized protein n=1 Tax=Halococcoides cellulosivorans TaxID=1679096 RepID=A0A2R4X2R8_9EURY|nr:hypothetical protein [Halococcoides cellulosivorans]AWB28097.1 hypothetical protein HARCEL1_10455 [Halococcoides cellulosivorans]